MRRYLIHTPAGPPVTVEAARAVVEHGALVLYSRLTGAEREAVIAAFSPSGWSHVEIAP